MHPDFLNFTFWVTKSEILFIGSQSEKEYTHTELFHSDPTYQYVDIDSLANK